MGDRRTLGTDVRTFPFGRGPIGQAGREDFPATGTRESGLVHLGLDAPLSLGEPPAGEVWPRSPGSAGSGPGPADAFSTFPTILALHADTFVPGGSAATVPRPARPRPTPPGQHLTRFAGELAARFTSVGRDASQPDGQPARRPLRTRDAAPETERTRTGAPAGAYVAASQTVADPESAGLAWTTTIARGARTRGTPASARPSSAVATPSKAAALPGIPQPSTVTWTFPDTGSGATTHGLAPPTLAGQTGREAWPLISTSLAAVSSVARLASRESGPLPTPAPESTRSEANGGDAVDLDGLAEEMATRILRRIKREKERRGDHGW